MTDRSRWYSRTCRPVRDPYIEVIVDGLRLTTTHEYRPFEIGYHLNGWRGWREGPEDKTGIAEYPDADGGLMEEALFSGRNLEFSGVMRGRDETHLHQMMEAMGAVLTQPRKGDLVVREQLLKMERQVHVKRGGRPVMTQVLPDMATWSLQFVSEDYRRLGTQLQSLRLDNPTAILRNLGNAPAALTLTLNGLLTEDPGISWSGGAWRYGKIVLQNQTIVADFENRIVRDPANTQHSRGEVGGAGEWLMLPPGETPINRLGVIGTGGSIVCTWRHSWY